MALVLGRAAEGESAPAREQLEAPASCPSDRLRPPRPLRRPRLRLGHLRGAAGHPRKGRAGVASHHRRDGVTPPPGTQLRRAPPLPPLSRSSTEVGHLRRGGCRCQLRVTPGSSVSPPQSRCVGSTSGGCSSSTAPSPTARRRAPRRKQRRTVEIIKPLAADLEALRAASGGEGLVASFETGGHLTSATGETGSGSRPARAPASRRRPTTAGTRTHRC